MQGDLFAPHWRHEMEAALDEISSALSALGKPDPWSPDLKASDEFLDPLFRKFYERLKLPTTSCARRTTTPSLRTCRRNGVRAPACQALRSAARAGRLRKPGAVSVRVLRWSLREFEVLPPDLTRARQ